MASKGIYVERRPDKRYAVTTEGATRASALFGTQEEAINYARNAHPDGEIHIERVRDVGPGPDKFRKP